MGIQNEHLLTDIFGSFPSFHDAEVLSLVLDKGEGRGNWLETLIHVFRITKEVDDENRLVTKDHVVVKFRFSSILNLRIDEFFQQNVLWNLEIKQTSDREKAHVKFKVVFNASVGMSAEFHCEAISIESVEPYVDTRKKKLNE